MDLAEFYTLEELTDLLMKTDLNVKLMIAMGDIAPGFTVVPSVSIGSKKYWQRKAVDKWLITFTKLTASTLSDDVQLANELMQYTCRKTFFMAERDFTEKQILGMLDKYNVTLK